MSIKFLIKIILFLLLFIFSCVELSFFIRVSPDGSYSMTYKGHGDKKDLYDYDFSIPNNKKWKIHSTLNVSDAETYDYTAKRTFKRNETFPISFYDGDSIYFESLLKHPLKVTHLNWLFWETFSFEGKFISRDVETKYPLVNELINDIENPPVGWMKEAIEYILLESLSQSGIEWNLQPIINSELNFKPGLVSGMRHFLQYFIIMRFY